VRTRVGALDAAPAVIAVRVTSVQAQSLATGRKRFGQLTQLLGAAHGDVTQPRGFAAGDGGHGQFSVLPCLQRPMSVFRGFRGSKRPSRSVRRCGELSVLAIASQQQVATCRVTPEPMADDPQFGEPRTHGGGMRARETRETLRRRSAVHQGRVACRRQPARGTRRRWRRDCRGRLLGADGLTPAAADQRDEREDHQAS
jgi:hypothetical protein